MGDQLVWAICVTTTESLPGGGGDPTGDPGGGLGGGGGVGGPRHAPLQDDSGGGGGGHSRPTEKNPPRTRNTPKDWIEEAWQQYQDCVKKGNQALSGFLPPPVNGDTLVRDAARDSFKGIRPNVPGLPSGGNMPTPPGKGAEKDIFEGLLQFVADTKRANIKADCLKKYPLAALSPSYSGEV